MHRSEVAYWGRGKRGGGGESEWVVRVFDPQKTEEAVDHRQNNYVKAVGTSPVRSNLCAPLIADLTARAQISRDTRTVSVAPAVGEQLTQRVVQPFEPSSISLLLISSGLS